MASTSGNQYEQVYDRTFDSNHEDFADASTQDALNGAVNSPNVYSENMLQDPAPALDNVVPGYGQGAPVVIGEAVTSQPNSSSIPSSNPLQTRNQVRFSTEEDRQPRATRIRVRPEGHGPTITVSQPHHVPTSGAVVSPIMETAHDSKGLFRPNKPGRINLEGLQPTVAEEHVVHVDPSTGSPGRTGAVNVDGADMGRLASLAHELDEQGSEAVSEEPPPGQAIIREEAFLPGLDTLPQNEHPNFALSNSDGQITPGATTDSSADPMESMDHVDLIEGETDGMPSKLPRSMRRKVSDSSLKGWQKIKKLMGTFHPEENTEDMAEKGLFSENATNMKSVPVKTSSGIRGIGGRKRPDPVERQAARLVKTHKLLSGAPASDTSDDDLPNLPGMNRAHLPDSEASTPDALDTMQHLDARPAASGGVLGQLLKLYEQQREADSQSEDGTSVVAGEQGNKPEEIGGGLNLMGDKVVDAFGNEAHLSEVDPDLLRKASEKPRLAGPQTGQSASRRMSMASTGLINLANQNLSQVGNNLGRVGNRSKAVVNTVATDVGIDVMDERPKAARSAAGTIGALIATTGNLVGAVSPLHAQLGPNPNRPGYTLDRYLLPEMDEKTLRRTAKIVAEAAPVPKKLKVPQTPGGHPLLTPNTLARVSQSDPNFNPYFGKASDARSTAGQSQISSKRAADFAKQSGATISHAGKQLLHLKRAPTSASEDGADYFTRMNPEEVAKKEWQRKLRRRKAKSKKQEIFITMHVAAILKRQEFLLKLSRALMMFGAPTHRIEVQIQQTANVLEINCRCVYFPGLMLLSFGDENTHTSETKIIKQGSVVDLTKLTDMHTIYWNVVHDKIGVEQASRQLDALMRRKPLMRKWQHVLVGGLASSFITVGTWAFQGSLLDAFAAFALGAFMCFWQLTITSEVYSNVFEIVFATINSFIAMALHRIGAIHTINWDANRQQWTNNVEYGRYFCYQSVIAGSIVLILPGFIVLTGALELQSKSIVAGSVRLVYAIIYSVMLGLGIMIGALPLVQSGDATVDSTTCGARTFPQFAHWYNTPPGGIALSSPDSDGHLYRSLAWAFLTVPGYAALLSLRNQAKVVRKEFPVMVFIAVCGWVVSNFAVFANVPSALQSHTYLFSAMGSFTVGTLANIYGRIFDGRSFVVAVPGILFQLPTGMSGQVTLYSFANLKTNDSSAVVTQGFQIGATLLNVSLGIAIGLFASSLLMFMLGGRKVRVGGMFSF